MASAKAVDGEHRGSSDSPYEGSKRGAFMTENNTTNNAQVKEKPISWLSLKNKGQLAVLCIVRLLEPLAGSSIYSYLFYQLKFLSPSASDAQIATHVGIIIGAKTVAKVCTGLFWGRFSDSSAGGRKTVLLIGLSSSCLASVGYGLSTTFLAACFWQVFSGAMCSNIGIVRCVVAEMNPEKRARSRALLLLPLFGSVGIFLGPLVGGLLSPTTIDAGQKYPYAPPNLLIAAMYGLAGILVLFFVEETLETHDTKADPIRKLWFKIKSSVFNSNSSRHNYSAVAMDESTLSMTPDSRASADNGASSPHQLIAFRDIWTSQVICTLIANFIISGHVTTFTALWSVFLSTPVSSHAPADSPFSFSGGLGLLPAKIGVVMSVVGAGGVVLQLFIYPLLNDRFGTIRVWRTALLIFPLTYFIAPFPALVASTLSYSSGNPDQRTRQTPLAVWAAVAGVLLFSIAGRMGVTPAMTLLLNDCVPAPSARGTVNTAGTVVANLSKSIFPVATMAIYGWGLRNGVVGIGFWVLSGLAVAAVAASRWVGNEQRVVKTERARESDEEEGGRIG